jgi:hypothetical protein
MVSSTEGIVPCPGWQGSSRSRVCAHSCCSRMIPPCPAWTWRPSWAEWGVTFRRRPSSQCRHEPGLRAAHRAGNRAAREVHRRRHSRLRGSGPGVRRQAGPSMFEMAARQLGLPAGEIPAAGDNLDSDIAGAKSVGARTALLVSGVSAPSGRTSRRGRPLGPVRPHNRQGPGRAPGWADAWS